MSCAEFIREILQNEWVAIVHLSLHVQNAEYFHGKLTIPKPDEEITDVLCEFGIKILSLPYNYDVGDIDTRVLDTAALIRPFISSKLRAYSHKLIGFSIDHVDHMQDEIKDYMMYPVSYCGLFAGIKNIIVDHVSDYVPDYDLNYVSTIVDCEYASIDYAKMFKTKYLTIQVKSLPQDFCDRWYELLDGTILECVMIYSTRAELNLSPIPPNINTRLQGYLLIVSDRCIKHDGLEEICALNSSARCYRTKSANKLG